MDAGDGTSLVLGGTTVALILKEGFAWLRGRRQKGEVTGRVDVGPQPLGVRLEEEYVRHREFDAYRADNEKAHADLFERMRQTEAETAEQRGTLRMILSQVEAISNKIDRLFEKRVRS